MTLREHIERINELEKTNPEALDLEVITSTDDEGNRYNKVYFEPTVGIHEDYDCFYSLDDYAECEELEEDEEVPKPNAVCLN